MGDTIMLRSLAKLPPLDQITFLRKESRAYVTGQGPYSPVNRPWLGFMLLGYGAAFTIAAIGVTLVGYQPMLILGHPLSPENDWMRQFGPIIFLPALGDLGLGLYFHNRARDEKRLAAEGALLPGEVVSARIRASKGGNYLQAEFQFHSPEGNPVTGTRNGQSDRSVKSPPAPGSQVLVLYDNPRLWQVL